MTTSELASDARPKPEYSRLHLGTAPDSWGIWFPDDPKQPHWTQFLDEVAETGFRTIELGPYGYLRTEPERLKDELGNRSLTLTGATVGTATHRGRDAFEQTRRDAFAICELLAAWTCTTWSRCPRCTPTSIPVSSTNLSTLPPSNGAT